MTSEHSSYNAVISRVLNDDYKVNEDDTWVKAVWWCHKKCLTEIQQWSLVAFSSTPWIKKTGHYICSHNFYKVSDDRFSKFFHLRTRQWLRNKMIIKDLITP